MQNLRNVVSAAALAAFIGAGAAPALVAEFVTNGSFEQVSGSSSPNFFLSDNEGNVTGWTTSSNQDFESSYLLRRPVSRPAMTRLSLVSGRARRRRTSPIPMEATSSPSTEIQLPAPGRP